MPAVRGLTGRRPLVAGRTSATAGSSQEPGGKMNKTFNNWVLYVWTLKLLNFRTQSSVKLLKKIKKVYSK